MKKQIATGAAALLLFSAAFASEPTIWTTNSRDDVLKGEARNVSVAADGTIKPSPGFSEIASTGQPYVWASAIDGSGNVYLGTGSDGKVFKVAASGGSSLLADLDELNVTALAVGRDGALFAATSPDGKIYRIGSDGKAVVFFEPREKYIWSLAVTPEGEVVVGTGESGKIYRVRSAGSSPDASLMFDSGETHIISLAVDGNGNIYAGTDAGGLVIRFGADRKPFALLDSPLREIHEIVIGVDGSVYALALSESVSAAESKPNSDKPKTPTVSAGKRPPGSDSDQPPKSRYDLSGAKSAVYRILPSGQVDIIWGSSDISAFALYAHQTGNGVMIGTSDRGRIYSVRNSGSQSLALQTGEGQVSSIKVFGNRLYAATSSQGKLFRIGDERTAESVYESPVLDAEGNAAWGRIWWRGTSGVEIQTRSGNTSSPDETWSAWSSAYSDPRGEPVSSPSASHLQWRAVFKPGNEDASLSEVHVSYLPTNIAPEVLSVELLPPNIGLAPNPKVPIDPNIETSGMDPADFGIVVPPTAPRKLFQRGARSLTWNAEDRNDDTLTFSVYFKEVGDAEFKLLEKNISETFFTVDGLAFADGRYIFKIVASDSPSNPVGTALTGEFVSDPFDIDNSAPSVAVSGNPEMNGNRARVKFEATESASFITRAEYSVNGGTWRAVYADDGIPDSRNERFTVEIELPSKGEYAIALRVFDAVGNSGSARALVRY